MRSATNGCIHIRNWNFVESFHDWSVSREASPSKIEMRKPCQVLQPISTFTSLSTTDPFSDVVHRELRGLERSSGR
jgi:hypothetical protein